MGNRCNLLRWWPMLFVLVALFWFTLNKEEQRSVRNTTQDILSPVSDLIPVAKPSEKTSPVSLSKYKWIVLPIAGLAYYFWPKYKHQLLAENEMSNPGIKTASGGFVSKYVTSHTTLWGEP